MSEKDFVLLDEGKSKTIRVCGICAMRVIPWAAFPHNYRALVSCPTGVAVYTYDPQDGTELKIVKVKQ